HGRPLQVVPGIRTVEGLVAQREVRDDVALERRLEERPLEPRGVPKMAARHSAVGHQAQPHQDVAPETLHQGHTLARPRRDRGTRLPRRQLLEKLANERERLLDLANADPYTCIHVAFGEHRDIEPQLRIGSIARAASDIEVTSGGTTDKSAGP